MVSRRVNGACDYSLFTFKPLPSLHLKIPSFVRECTVMCLTSDGLRNVCGEKKAEG